MKTQETELALAKHNAQAIEKAPPSVGEMLQAVIDRGIGKESVEVMSKLCDLHERVEDRQAKKDFARAFRELQRDLKPVQPNKAVPNRDGSTRFTYASYDELMAQIGPVLDAHGFTVSFSTKISDGRVTSVCTLMHESGHERSNEYTCRIGSGPPGSSESQADGAANQYAQRGALCDCLNIVVSGRDNDARHEGAAISQQQAEELERRVAETNSDKAKFLKLAGAESFAEIKSDKYDMLDSALARKERTGR